MSAIFISHSSQDNAVAEEIRTWLAEQGHRSVFLDFDPADGIPAGRDWEQELYRNIRVCRAVIVLCSEHSMASRWCFMEITHARALGKHLFPVKIGDCDLDGVLTDRQVINLTGNRDEALERLGRGILASGLDPADAFDWDGSRPPYPGLLAFQEEDAAIFFGRDDEIGEGLDLVTKVRRLGQTKLVMVLGTSGSGKSSLVRAGLLPRLRRDTERWLVVDPLRPRDDPARELAMVLSRAFDRAGRTLPWERIAEQVRSAMARVRVEAEEDPPTAEDKKPKPARKQQALEQLAALEATLEEDANARVARFLRLLRTAVTQQEGSAGGAGLAGSARSGGGDDVLGELADDLRRRGGREESRVLLVIDQFEELLGHGPDHANSRFLHLLRTGLDRPGSSLLALGTMRSDFLGAFQKSPALLDMRYEALSLGPMSTDDVAQVIEKPAQLAAIELETGLVQALVDDAETEDALPLLAFTLRELNERFGEDGLLEIHEYRERLGGLRGAVAKAADEILDTEPLNAEGEADLRAAFLSLVRITEDGTYARQTAHWDELPEAVHPLLERFVQGRLLVAGSDDQGRTLEVAHEALFRSWTRLVRWLEESGEALRLRHEIQLASRSWETNDRVPDDLWRGGRLARARELMESGDLPLEPLGREFLDASHDAEQAQKQAEEARRQRELRRTRRFLIAVSVVALLAVGLGVFAYFKQIESAASADQAARSLARTHVQDGIRLLGDVQASRALASFAAAVRRYPADPAPRRHILDLLATMGRPRPVSPLKHDYDVYSAAFTPDGSRVVTASEDKTAQVWDADTGDRIGPALRHDEEVVSAAFSLDGRRVVTASWDKTAQVWDAETGAKIGPALQHDEEVNSAAFSPDGRRVLTASWDKTAQVWDADTGDKIGPALRHDEEVDSAAFSPDGRRVVTASWDKTAQVWDAETGAKVGQALQHDDEVNSAVFSPDGRRVVTASEDATAQVWNAETGDKIGQALEHVTSVVSAAFSPDGRRVVTASYDSARLWDAQTGFAFGPVLNHGDVVLSAAFSPDGRRVLTTCGDHTAQVWDAETGDKVGQALKHGDNVFSAAFSPDGRRVVTASEDKTAQLWDAETGDKVGTILKHDYDVYSAAFTPDGSRVVTASGDKAAQVWNAETGDRVGQVLQHVNTVVSAAFSLDGRRVVTASADKTAQVWDAETGAKIGPALEHGYGVTAAAFSPDGRRVLTASSDKTAQVWNAETGDRVGQVLQHVNTVVSAAFSLDGRRVVTASADKTAQVWDAETGAKIGPALEHGYGVTAAAFSPDGRRVVTASWDKTAQVWDAETGAKIGPALEHGYGVTAAAFSPDGRRVLTASSDKTAQLWHTETGDKAGPALQHGGRVNSAAFSPDGRRVVTASADKTAQVWDAETGDRVGPALQHGEDVASAAFSPDGRRVVTASRDATAQVWDTPTGLAGTARLLAETAEAVAGYYVTELGVLAPVEDRGGYDVDGSGKRTLFRSRASLLETARAATAQGENDSDMARVLRWYFSDPRIRTISPLSSMTVPEFILRFPERAKSHFPWHPVTQRCVWPLGGDLRPGDLDPDCVQSALDSLIAAELLQPAEKHDLLESLPEQAKTRN